jgi:hypothetical protein
MNANSSSLGDARAEGARADSSPGVAGDEPLARWTLLALIVAAPLIFGLRLLFAEPTPHPAPEKPTWMHTVLVTVDRWPTPKQVPEGPALDQLAVLGSRIGPLFAASTQLESSAVSLWTGSYPPRHRVRGPEERLPDGAWSLASAATEVGTRTAAFTQTGIVERTGLPGFETLFESSGSSAAELGQRAGDWLRQRRNERKLLWVHLDRGGPHGAFVDDVFAPILAALRETGELSDCLLAFTALGGPEQGIAEFQARVPFLMALPGGLHGGSDTPAHLSLVDLAGLWRQLLRLPPPDSGRGQSRLQSREEFLWAGFKGIPQFHWVWVEGDFGHVVRQPGLRVGAALGAGDALDFRALGMAEQGPQARPPLAPEMEPAARAAYLEVRTAVFGASE